ncbi:MAG: hypothetical protein ACRBBN_12220 [Methyloligellaceae bacterium]
MLITFGIFLVAFLSICILAGAIIKYIIRPGIKKEIENKEQELRLENLELKKKLTELTFSERTIQMVEIERVQNLALLNMRALIVRYVKWERPSRQIRIYLSFITALLSTLIIFQFIHNVDETQELDFWGICALMFIFCYYIWGSIIETTWKQRQLNKMKVEFFKMISLSKNPLEARDNLIEWMAGSIDVADPIRRFIEGLLETWMRQDIRKKLKG